MELNQKDYEMTGIWLGTEVSVERQVLDSGFDYNMSKEWQIEPSIESRTLNPGHLSSQNSTKLHFAVNILIENQGSIRYLAVVMWKLARG